MDKSGPKGTWTFHAIEVLSKRELFAGLAMAGMLSHDYPPFKDVAELARAMADALMAELAKEEGA